MELLMLPEELLLSIIASIDDITTLRHAATVCKHLNDLVEPYLYQSLTITDGSQAVMLEEAIAKRPFRGSHIRSLLASTRFTKAKGIEHLPGSLAAMRNLRELSLETPDCNQKEPGERIPWIRLQERYERIFQHSSLLLPPQTRSLPRLRSCTSIFAGLLNSLFFRFLADVIGVGSLHFVDELKELCSLAKYASLFLHPTLRFLRISCASTDYPSQILPTIRGDTQFFHSTSLETLHLEECDLFPATLALLLCFPRALKSLIISEGTRYKPRNGHFVRKHGNMIPKELTNALNVQKESLEHLSLSLGFCLRIGQHVDDPQYHLDFSAFESLRVLELDSRASKLMAPRGRTPMGRLPPTVETLKIFRLRLNPLRDIPDSAVLGPTDLNMPFSTVALLRRIKDAYPKFKRLEYLMEYSADFDGELEDAIQPEILILVRLSHGDMHRSKFRLSDDALKLLGERSATIKEFGIQMKLGILVT